MTHPLFRLCCLILLYIVTNQTPTRLHADDATQSPAQFRRPVAAVWVDDGQTLIVANRRSGSLSVIDRNSWLVAHEQTIGESLSDLCLLGDGHHLLATDERAGQVHLIDLTERTLTNLASIDVPATPVSLCLCADEGVVSVASLWPRTLTLLAVDHLTSIDARHTIELPFAPRMQALLPDGRHLVVCDSFGGKLGIVDVAARKLTHLHEIDGTNLRGMVVDADRNALLIAHQQLHHWGKSEYHDILWGDLLSNLVTAIPIDRLLDASADLDRECREIDLGMTGHAAGDPAGIALFDDDRMVVAAAGVNALVIGSAKKSIAALRTNVGQRPTVVHRVPGTQQCVVLNTFDDSVSIVDVVQEDVITRISLGPMPASTLADRGEMLFYDARLSLHGWLSCHSCHTDGHANGKLVDTLGDGSYETPKRVLSLLGTRDNNPWAWNGSMRNLHEQVEKSVRSTMQGGGIAPQQTLDIVAYLHTLPPAPPRRPVIDDEPDRRLLQRGREVFAAQNCGHCHVPTLTYTSDQIVDVGLEDEQGLRKFNPPSLRGVGQRARFFHDGRATTLIEVIQEHGHQIQHDLNNADAQALVRFLMSL